MENKYFIGTIKILITAKHEVEATQLIKDALGPLSVDWGFAATPQGRAFFRQVELPPDLLELRAQVDADEQGPEPELEIGQAEADERRKDYEQLFDSI